jgi:IS5 family transposase
MRIENSYKPTQAMGLQVKCGTVQDATFIEADPGSSKKPRGEDAKTRRSRDGTWAKKGNETHLDISCTKKPISITA